MKVLADLSIVPLGVGLSLSPYVAQCERILVEAGLEPCLHANGTNVEGEWDQVVGALKKGPEVLHGMGVTRIATNLRCGTRTDKVQAGSDKIRSVQEKI